MNYIITRNCLIFLFFPIFSLFAQKNTLPSLYVGEINPKDRESSQFTAKIRSQVVTSVLRYQRNKYNILDDELIKQLSDKIAKLQKQGCDDTECKRALDLAINWDEKIIGDLQKEGDQFSLSLKVYEMDKDTYQPRVKGSLFERFYPYQMDFYVNEMSRAIMDLKYSPDYSRAPKKEGEKVTEKSEPTFEKNPFWGNLIFPGYNRIYNNDNSGYVLGSLWTVSLMGIVATYPAYSNAKSSNSSWARNAFIYPFLLPSGSEILGSAYVVNQMNGFYDEATNKSQTINGLGGFAFLVWSYSWFYNPELSTTGLYKIPHSDWVLDFQINRRTERIYSNMFDNQIVLQIGRSFE